jgi:arylformamidase
MPDIYDISMPISPSMIIWPGDPPVRITQPRHFDKGDDAVVSQVDMGVHTGTHVDAPEHFVRGGSNMDDLELGVLIGPALVVHAPKADALSADVLSGLGIPPGTERLLLRTRNSDRRAQQQKMFWEDFCAITEEGARWLVARQIRLVGIDYLSVGPYGRTGPTHRILLEAGVIPLEGLDLSAVPAGVYHLVCLPLRIAGVEGAPARAVLMRG